MKKFLKICLLVPIFLVILTPTYVLIYHVSETVAPTVTVGQTQLNPAHVGWHVVRKNQTVSITEQDRQEAADAFAQQSVVILPSLLDVTGIECSREPESVEISLFDLTGSGITYETMNVEDLYNALINGQLQVAGKTQVVIAIEWKIGDNIYIHAMYSVEVYQ